MLTGMFPPTSGTAIIDGKDLTTNIDGVRESLGLCPQHNILFDELTVKEHIIFFSSLKGMKGNELKEEIRKYVDLLGLTHKMNKQSHTLSGGMKRKLSVGIALCGNSKVVLIDEASSGMDPAARRSLWDLLQEVKHGRTILLSTHFMDEADVLGDRIAIMAEGELQAVGSSYFLKKRFGVGYRMVCAKEVGCNTNDITAQLKSYVNDVELESDIGTEVTFILNQANVQLFKDMLESFENNMKALRISSYGISLTTMEEVFLKVGVNAHALHSNNHDQTDGRDFVALQTGEEYGASKLTGSSMVINQVIAMLKKKFLYTLRKYKPLILMLILCIFLLVSLKMNKIELKSSIAPMKISWDQYQQTTAIVANSDQSPISDAYFKLFDNPGHYYETVPKSMTIDAFILKKVSLMDLYLQI